MSAGRSTGESLAGLGDSEIDAALALITSLRAQPDEREDQSTVSYLVGTTSGEGLRFRVLRPHARGGLGAVFVALDTELHREVALKQLQDHHADDLASRKRFLLEAEVTGGLEHPGIVPVYGLGAYADGRPFYAMRFVRGDNLKEAIDHFQGDVSLREDPGRRSLELRKLLRRFLDVCNAIGYAHSRGVLHRDLKPGNIIVGRHGETLVVDWGLAKATGSSDPTIGERTLAPSSASGSAETLPGSALGTPAYMSPEQARGELDRLGPRSDVYSLGATLYCLLTGRPPLEGELADVLRRAQASEIPPPRTFDPTIDRALEGVCLKAMAPRPEDRYASCKALADELELWLADEPVTAWREPLTRRARRWARRNRTAVVAGAVVLVAGVVGLSAITAIQARSNTQLRAAKKETEDALVRSEESRRQAEAVSTFLVDTLRSPDPSLDGRQVKVVDLLDRAGADLGKSFTGNPRVKAEVLDALSRTYHGLQLIPEAIPPALEAWTIRKKLLGPKDRETLRSMSNLGEAYTAAYRTDEAIPLLQQALELQEATIGPDDPETFETMASLAAAYGFASRVPEANALFEETLKRQRRVLGANHRATLKTASTVAHRYGEAGRDAEALALLREVQKLQVETLGRGHPDTVHSTIRLANAIGSDDPEESVRLLEEALRQSEENQGPGNPVALWAMTRLIDFYGLTRQHDKAIAIGERALELGRAKVGPDNPHTLHTVAVLARAYRETGRLDRCLELSQEAYRLGVARLGHEHGDAIWYLADWTEDCVAKGRFAEAEGQVRAALPRIRKSGTVDRSFLARTLASLGRGLLAEHRWQEAEPILRENLTIRESGAPDRWATFDARSLLGESLLGQGRFAEAEPLILSGYQGMIPRRRWPFVQYERHLAAAALRIIRLYEAWGKPEEATGWKARLNMSDLPPDVFSAS